MHVAFHFDEQSVVRTDEEDEFPLRLIEQRVLAGVLAVVPGYRQHLRIRSGIPAVSRLPRERTKIEEIAADMLLNASTWRTLASLEDYVEFITERHLSVQLLEGIALDDAIELDALLGATSGYLGAMQVRLDSPPQWAFYSRLRLRYRVHHGVVSLLYSLTEAPEIMGEDSLDHYWRKHLAGFLIPRGALTVDFACSGLEGTLLDPRNSWEDARRAGRVDRVLGSLLSGVVDEIYLRARQVDPVIIEIFDAALIAMETHETPAQLSHVALSCRRLLERLADALYSPRDEFVDGRKVSVEKYVNRLWAYIRERLTSETESRVLLTNLDDVGNRINAINAASNKGLHGQAAAVGIHRLLVNLIMLTYDLLSLNDINAVAAPAYDREQVEIMKAMILGSIRDGSVAEDPTD